MGRVLQFTITTTPQNIVVGSVATPQVEVKEDESVVGWPTVNLLFYRSQGGQSNFITKGKSIFISPASPRNLFYPGEVIGLIACDAGSTTGIQDES